MSTSSLNTKIRQYVAIHGFGEKIPPLTQHLSADVFRQHYYQKTELMEFCREHKIPTYGLKNELNERIEFFLRNKRVRAEKTVSKSKATPDSELGLRLDRQVVNYKSDPATRSFFERHIPEFTGFSAYVQKWLKARLSEDEIFTYADVVAEHKRYLNDKSIAQASGDALKVAHDSCQLNQFSSDYSHDDFDKPHSNKEAWELVRNSAGDKTYARYKAEIIKIKAKLEAEKSNSDEQDNTQSASTARPD